MKRIKIVQNYSKILYEQAVLHKALTKVQSDLMLLKELCNYELVKMVLERPIIKIQQKIELIDEISKICRLHKTTISVLSLLLKNNFIAYLLDIIIDFENIVDEHLHNISADFITASKISEKVLKEMQTMFGEMLKENFSLNNKVDPSIIGGGILRYKGYEYDVSILGAIGKLRSGINYL